MNESKRKFMKALPLAAMAAATVNIGEHSATAYEMKPDKKYILYVPGISDREAKHCHKLLTERGVNVTIIGGNRDLTIYELD